MKLYEGLFLLDSNLVSKDGPGMEKHIQDILTRHGSEILYTERWPDRRLAYDVKGCKKGSYYLTYFNAPATAIPEINRDVQISERVLRVMIIHEAGIDEELERRKNKEIVGPPAELSYPRDRGAFRRDGRSRRERDHRREPREETRERARGGTTEKPAEATTTTTEEASKSTEGSGVGAVLGEDKPESTEAPTS